MPSTDTLYTLICLSALTIIFAAIAYQKHRDKQAEADRVHEFRRTECKAQTKALRDAGYVRIVNHTYEGVEVTFIMGITGPLSMVGDRWSDSMVAKEQDRRSIEAAIFDLVNDAYTELANTVTSNQLTSSHSRPDTTTDNFTPYMMGGKPDDRPLWLRSTDAYRAQCPVCGGDPRVGHSCIPLKEPYIQ